MPTEEPERQEVINKGQSAYRRTRASRRYQQRPECLPKDQSVKKLSTKARVPTEGPERQKCYQQRARGAKLEHTTNDQHDGNHTRIGRSYTMVVPMNISSHREVGDLAKRRANETLIRTRKNARSRPRDNIRQDDYYT